MDSLSAFCDRDAGEEGPINKYFQECSRNQELHADIIAYSCQCHQQFTYSD